MCGVSRTLAAQQQPCKTGSDVRSFRLSDHQALARQASRPAAALFAADAERRQGLDHAGGDRAAVRGASGRLQQGRPEDAGIPVAQSERQDPGDPRSRRAGRQAAAAVRVRRDPAIPRREDRQAFARRCRRGATRPSSGCISRWAASGRCSARSASSTNSPARISRTSGRSSAMSRSRSACSA